MKKTIALLATVALLTGCGGGGSSDSGSSTGGNGNTGGSTAYYNAFIPLKDNPSTFTCDENSTIEGMIAVEASFSSKEACETYAQNWINDYNQNDTPTTQEQQDALEYINTLRRGVGMPEFKHNALLEKATTNHQNYLGDVNNNYNVNSGHYEDNNTYPSDYYTGVLPSDRAKFAGYDGYYAGDVISFGGSNATESIKTLITAVYHRQALFWNFMHEIGISKTSTYTLSPYPHLMGAKQETDTFVQAITPMIVAYPYDKQTNVQRAFIAHWESPDPLPNKDTDSGNPITVTFNSYYTQSVELSYFKLYNENTRQEVTNTILIDQESDKSAGARFSEYDFALFTEDILDANTTYRVEIAYVLNGESGIKVWSFTTGQ